MRMIDGTPRWYLPGEMRMRDVTFNDSIVVDCRDLPMDVEDWCISKDYSTHYQNEVVMIWVENKEGNPLLDWLKSEGVDIEKYQHQGVYYVSLIGT